MLVLCHVLYCLLMPITCLCQPFAVDANASTTTYTNTMQVTANPELRGVVARGASMLPTRVVERAFKPLYGQPLNFVAFGKAVKKLDDWYQQRGILGQVRGSCFGPGGVLCPGPGGMKLKLTPQGWLFGG